MSYDIASKKYKEIEEKGFKIAIADEAHLLKSQDVSQFNSINSLNDLKI